MRATAEDLDLYNRERERERKGVRGKQAVKVRTAGIICQI